MENIPTTDHIVASRLLLCLSFAAIDLGYAVSVGNVCGKCCVFGRRLSRGHIDSRSGADTEYS